MYIDILNKIKANLEKDRFKAEKCKGILKSLYINTRDVEKYLEHNQEQIEKIEDKFSEFNNSEKRTNVTTIRIFGSDNFGSIEGEDLENLSEVMRKFQVTPYVSYCSDSSDYPYRKLCFVSDEILSKYEVKIINDYMKNAGYFKAVLINSVFKWDGNTLSIITEPNK